MGIILSSKTTTPNAHSMIFDETYRLTFMAPAVCLSTKKKHTHINQDNSIYQFEKATKQTFQMQYSAIAFLKLFSVSINLYKSLQYCNKSFTLLQKF